MERIIFPADRLLKEGEILVMRSEDQSVRLKGGPGVRGSHSHRYAAFGNRGKRQVVHVADFCHPAVFDAESLKLALAAQRRSTLWL